MRKAIASSRITTLPNGEFDPKGTDAEWGAGQSQQSSWACMASGWMRKQRH